MEENFTGLPPVLIKHNYVHLDNQEFEDRIFEALKDPEKSRELLQNIYEEFTCDFNDPKNKRYVDVIQNSAMNGFYVKKAPDGLLISSKPIRNDYDDEVKQFLPKTIDAKLWVNEAKHFFGIQDDKEFHDSVWLGKQLYSYAKLGLSFSEQAHHVYLMSRCNKDKGKVNSIYLQLEGIKHLMVKGGCRFLAYDVILEVEGFQATRTPKGDTYEHHFNVRNGEDLTIEKIKGAYAFCDLNGYGYLEYMTRQEVRKCYEASETYKYIKSYNDTKQKLLKDIQASGKFETEEAITAELKNRMAAQGVREPSTPWYCHPGEMIKKTVIRRLIKRIYQLLTSCKTEIMKVVSEDDSIEYNYK